MKNLYCGESLNSNPNFLSGSVFKLLVAVWKSLRPEESTDKNRRWHFDYGVGSDNKVMGYNPTTLVCSPRGSDADYPLCSSCCWKQNWIQIIQQGGRRPIRKLVMLTWIVWSTCNSPGTRYTLQDQVPPGPGTPLGPGTSPATEHAGRYGQRTGGRHPTGMQSCYFFNLWLQAFKI